MGDVNKIAKDIGVEVKDQGKKIEDINGNMEEAKDNVEMGKEQLEAKRNRGVTANKWLLYLLAGVFGFCLLLIFIVMIKRR